MATVTQAHTTCRGYRRDLSAPPPSLIAASGLLGLPRCQRLRLDRPRDLAAGKDGLIDIPSTLHQEPLGVNVTSEPKQMLSEPQIVQ